MEFKDSSFKEFTTKAIESINQQFEHPLNKFCSYNYYSDFFTFVGEILKNGTFSRVKCTTFLNKLQLGSTFDNMKYMQFISELTFINYAITNMFTFSIDKKLQLECGKHTDVDLQISDGDSNINIEVKCPYFIRANSNQGILNVNMSFRTTDKNALNDTKIQLGKDVLNPIINHPQSEFKNFKFEKLRDLKLVDYLKSAQDKFPAKTEKNINVLAIAVHISELSDYWGYLYNGYSGLFVENKRIVIKSKNSDGIDVDVTINDYNKVDVIYLTTLPTGHCNPKDSYNSFNLNSYMNLLCINPFSNKIKALNKVDYQKLYKVLPNDNERFEIYYDEFVKKIEENNLPIEGLLFPEYLATYYPQLWR